jgi:hypothetical protein
MKRKNFYRVQWDKQAVEQRRREQAVQQLVHEARHYEWDPTLDTLLCRVCGVNEWARRWVIAKMQYRVECHRCGHVVRNMPLRLGAPAEVAA